MAGIKFSWYPPRLGPQIEGPWPIASIARPGGSAANDSALPAANSYLPQPPTRTEKYCYFRNRRPFVFAWLLVQRPASFTVTCVSPRSRGGPHPHSYCWSSWCRRQSLISGSA